MRLWFFVAAWLAVVPLMATTITSVKFEGLDHISEQVAQRMLPFKSGEELDQEKIDQAIMMFFKQGYFEDIRVDETDGVLTFYFTGKPVISRLEMKGYKEREKEEQEALLQIKKGSLYDEKRIEEAKKRIIDALSRDGKIDSIVEVETERLEGGSMQVTFIVNEGEKIVIKNIDFGGMKSIEADELDEVIANKERQYMGWMWGRNDGKMALEQLEYDPLRIRDYYMQRGFLDAEVEEPFVRVDFDNYTADMRYRIVEGDVYRVSAIHLSQESEVIDNAELLGVVELTQNEAFNIKTFRDDADRIKTKIADLGYAYVQVTPDLRRDTEAKTVDVYYRIKPGEKVYIRNVVIGGNTRTLDRIIRRELYLAPGDLYSLTDLKDSRGALGRTGYFDSTTIEEMRIDARLMDLIVKVKEAPTGNIQVGGGYGSYGGLMVTMAVNDRNIFGTGINMGVDISNDQLSERYSFNIANPRLNDSDFSGNFSIYKNTMKYVDYYTVNTAGLSLGTGHRITRHLNGQLSYSYAQNSYDDINESAVNYNYLVFFEDYAKSSVALSLAYDNTDDYYLPREGVTAAQVFEVAGLGGNADFFKSRTNFSIFYGLEDLVGWDVIFRNKARYNFVNDTGYLPLAEKFYLGGVSSLRGFESYSLAPSYIDSSGNIRRVGGTQTFSNSVELSFPLLPSAKMRLSAFYDWGWIKGEIPDYTTTYNRPMAGSMSELTRSSIGLAVEWFSPVGPIQLIFADALDEKVGDRTSNFEFTIGQRF